MLYHRRGTYELLSMEEGGSGTHHSTPGTSAHAPDELSAASSTTGERQRKYSKKFVFFNFELNF